MGLKVQKVDTWVAELEDKPGSLAGKLDALAQGGVNLEFVIARRAPEKPGTGVVFVAGLKGAAGSRAARKAGFLKTSSLHTIRVEGADKKGRGANLAQALADGDLNIRGVSGAAMQKKFVGYFALDTAADAAKAARILRTL